MILWDTARIFISHAGTSSIQAIGRVVKTLEPGRLYRVEMANGYLAYAVLAKLGPVPENGEADGHRVGLEFSPFDMSRCHLVSWLPEDA